MGAQVKDTSRQVEPRMSIWASKMNKYILIFQSCLVFQSSVGVISTLWYALKSQGSLGSKLPSAKLCISIIMLNQQYSVDTSNRIALSTEQKHFFFTYSSSDNFFYFCLLRSLGTLSYSVDCETFWALHCFSVLSYVKEINCYNLFQTCLLTVTYFRGRCKLSTLFEVNCFYVSHSFSYRFLYFEGKGHSHSHLHFTMISSLRLQYFTVRLWPGTVLNSRKLW